MSTFVSIDAEIGNRLREERELLGLSQALLAAKMGVSRMSQVNYESGKRSPDAAYLRAAFEAGVDVGYVVTGKRTGTPDFFRMATWFVLESIESRTGLAEDVLRFVIESIAEVAASEWLKDRAEIEAKPGLEWDMTQWIDLSMLDELLASLKENAQLLRDIFGAINTELRMRGPYNLSPEKRVSVVLMMFKAFRDRGSVDEYFISEAIKLARDERWDR